MWGHLCIHAQKTGCQSGVWSCIMPGQPTHLVQELNVGTVPIEYAILAMYNIARPVSLFVFWLYKHPWITCLRNKSSISMTHVIELRSYESKLRSGTCVRTHAQENGSQSVVRLCLMPGLPTHLVQELNVCTVVTLHHIYRVNNTQTPTNKTVWREHPSGFLI